MGTEAHMVLIFKLKDPVQRLWYGHQATANGWSRSMLEHWKSWRGGARTLGTASARPGETVFRAHSVQILEIRGGGDDKVCEATGAGAICELWAPT
jgi:hypothetical protein